MTAAYEVLYDADKRRQYDLQKDGFGPNVFYARPHQPFGGGHQHYTYYTNFGDGDDPTEAILR